MNYIMWKNMLNLVFKLISELELKSIQIDKQTNKQKITMQLTKRKMRRSRFIRWRIFSPAQHSRADFPVSQDWPVSKPDDTVDFQVFSCGVVGALELEREGNYRLVFQV